MAAKITNKRPEIKPMWVLGGQYKIMRCNLLRKFHEVKHGFIYDVVIKYRADLTINKVPPIEKTDCIVQPIGHDSIGQHDIFGWGPTHFMDCWLDLFSYLQWYIEDGVLFHPEYLLKHHLKNVPIKRIPFELWLRGEKVCG